MNMSYSRSNGIIKTRMPQFTAEYSLSMSRKRFAFMSQNIHQKTAFGYKLKERIIPSFDIWCRGGSCICSCTVVGGHLQCVPEVCIA
jgi:hypothetical protein